MCAVNRTTVSQVSQRLQSSLYQSHTISFVKLAHLPFDLSGKVRQRIEVYRRKSWPRPAGPWYVNLA